MMRATDPGSAVGLRIMQIAVLLVGVMSWVRQGIGVGFSDSHPGNTLTPNPHPLARVPAAPSRRGKTVTSWFLPLAHREWERGPGGEGLLSSRIKVGLSLTFLLSVCLYILLRHDFSHPLAPWLWVLMLAALVLTFVGVGPIGPSPMAEECEGGEGGGRARTEPLTQPSETAIREGNTRSTSGVEPPISRGEWLAIGVILLVATAVRVWSLETVPTGPYTDEGDRILDARHINRGQLFNHGSFIFFGTGWWGVPSVYFWLVAQSMKVFGDTLAGARVLHALAGVATVWFTYRIGRLVWSPRVGLLAAGLLAISDFAIQFSRTAGESTITLLTWTACIYYLYRATKTCRLLDWVLGGIWGGFTLLGYASGKLLPLFLVVAGVYLLVRWGRRGAQVYLPGLSLMAFALLLTYGPNLLYVRMHPDALYMRYDGVTIFSSAASPALSTAYHTQNWIIILIRQFAVTFSAFDTGSDHGPFYPTGVPILPLVWAALWVLGSAYLVWRLREARFFLLGVWLLGGLAGAALTTDTPTLQRTAAVVPLLALIPAIFVVRLLEGLPGFRPISLGQIKNIRPPNVVMVLSGILVVALGIQTLNFYFGIYTPMHAWEDFSLAGRYAQTLNPHRDMIYHADIPERFWGFSPDLFLADHVVGRDMGDASNDLPAWDNGDKTAHFLTFPSNAAYISLVREYYPGGRQHVILNSRGLHWTTDYIASGRVLDAARRVWATYRSSNGASVRRLEPRIGTLSGDGRSLVRAPGGLTFPVTASWEGGLDAPAYGTYRFSLRAPEGAELTIDGRQVLRATGSQTIKLVLARGVNTIRLTGTLPSTQSRIDLTWGSAIGSPMPISGAFLWHAPMGGLLANAYMGATEAALTARHLDTKKLILTVSRRDGLIDYHYVNLRMEDGTHVFAVWRGKLIARTSGTYTFDPRTDGSYSIWVDGRLIGTNAAVQSTTALRLPSTRLARGAHRFEVRFLAAHDNQAFELFWRPPGGSEEILPPSALIVPTGGVWSVRARPQTPGIDPSMLAGEPVIPPVT
jgi:4-amino-4-deoxy-L-arabinose transferase-like glycosyltransferase